LTKGAAGAAARWPSVDARLVTGTVASFDDARGVGTVADDGGGELFFHCSEIADGSRQIEVGRPVSFVVSPGHRGRLEARHVEKR